MVSPLDPATEFPRLGYLYDSREPEAAAVPASLRVEADRGIRVDVPFTAGSQDNIGRWFGRQAAACPEQLLFQDRKLDVHLLGVSVWSFTEDPRYSPGTGTLRADYAIEDPDRSDVDYTLVEAIQSEIDGLHEFMGWKLGEWDFSPEETGAQGILHVSAPPPVQLTDFAGLTVTLTPSWWAGDDRPNVKALGESTLVRTRSQVPRSLSEHLRVHESVRDLIALCCWQPFDFREIRVHREDAPARALAGNPVGPAWRIMHSPHPLQRHHGASRPDVLFSDVRRPSDFTTLGIDGLNKWLRTRNDLARVIDPLLVLLYAPVISPELALMQTSISAEAMGFQRAIRSGLSSKAASRQSFFTRLKEIVATQPLPVEDIAGDRDHWLREASNAYNGIKHADRVLPEHPVPTLIALTTTMLLRSQILLELGVDASSVAGLAERQNWWGLRQAYTALADWPA